MLKGLVGCLRRKSYFRRPLGSYILAEHLRRRRFPTCTSFFVRYRDIQDDHFAQSHYNFQVDSTNYHILRTGCYPFVKYHCSRVEYRDLTLEDNFFRALKALNFGIPCLAYGVAAIFLVRHREEIITSDVVFLLFFVFPAIYFMGVLTRNLFSCLSRVAARALRPLTAAYCILWKDEAGF